MELKIEEEEIGKKERRAKKTKIEKSREKGGIDKDKEERGIRKNIGRREKLYGIGEDRETERLEG